MHELIFEIAWICVTTGEPFAYQRCAYTRKTSVYDKEEYDVDGNDAGMATDAAKPIHHFIIQQ